MQPPRCLPRGCRGSRSSSRDRRGRRCSSSRSCSCRGRALCGCSPGGETDLCAELMCLHYAKREFISVAYPSSYSTSPSSRPPLGPAPSCSSRRCIRRGRGRRGSGTATQTRLRKILINRTQHLNRTDKPSSRWCGGDMAEASDRKSTTTIADFILNVLHVRSFFIISRVCLISLR